MRVLVVEDEPKLAGIIQRGMAAHGLSADVATTGEEALCLAGGTAYEAIVLDVLLPDVNGLEVCRRLRAAGVDAPVLMLTALGTVADRVAGLDQGADDYLPKPFAFDELMARLRALARRPGGPREPVLQVGDLCLDPATRSVTRAGTPIALTVKEFALLEALMRRAGRTVSRFELLESAWDQAYENRSNIIDVYLRYLREKVDRPFAVTSIETVRGVGYRIVAGRP
jgi:two-component system OmpR family response regulator